MLNFSTHLNRTNEPFKTKIGNIRFENTPNADNFVAVARPIRKLLALTQINPIIKTDIGPARI